MDQIFPPKIQPNAIIPRALSADNKINLIIGVLTIAIGILSIILAWVMWRLAKDRHGRMSRYSPSPPPTPLQIIQPHVPNTNRSRNGGYEVAFRIGRSM